MNHPDFTTRRGAADPTDRRPACRGDLVLLCYADMGDADWEVYQCLACAQYFITAGTHGETWNRIVTADWYRDLLTRGRTRRS